MSKAKTKRFVGAHIPREDAEQLDRLADQNHRSTAAEIRIAIENHLNANRKVAEVAA